ncbi:GNAT family N-acetyltransferase [Peptostreptococcaceae bacterium OttesenSCG-928-C18]|nr:GNAT family N-acetyltransferase [Peptostreptococcaceae bacterium OttesenSCG-928-C18]
MSNFIAKLRSKGLRGSLVSITSRFYSKNYLIKVNISDAHKIKNDYKIKEINQEINEYLKDNEDEFKIAKYEQFKERISKDNITGYVIYSKNEVAGYLWTMTGEMEEGLTGYVKKLQDDEMYIYDGYTFEKHRRLGMGHSLISIVLKERSNKYKIAYGIVDSLNYKSTGMLQKVGFKKHGIIYTFKIFGKKFKKVVMINGN